MKKIIGAYKNTNKNLTIESSGNAFRIILPNLNFQSSSEKSNSSLLLTKSNEEKLLEFLQKNNIVTRIEVEKLLGVGTSTAFRLLKSMVDNGVLAKEGKGENTKYIYTK